MLCFEGYPEFHKYRSYQNKHHHYKTSESEVVKLAENIHFRERYIYIFLILISIVCILLIPSQIGEGMPRLFPYITLSVVGLCSVMSLINCLKGKEVVVSFPKNALLNIALGILIFIIYIFSIEYLGYYFVSAIFIVVSLFHFKIKRLRLNLILAITVPLVIYFLLDYLLGLKMPSGWFL